MDAKTRAACAAIGEPDWVDIKYPQAIWDEDERRWISDAQIAETAFTAFAGTRQAITARLIVRRVKRLADPDQIPGQGELFDQYRYHAVFTDSPFVLEQAEAHHRGHAVIEQVNAELIDGPLAHLPSGRFAANNAWLACAAITQPHPRRRAPGRPALRGRPPGDHPYPDHQRRRPAGTPRPRHPPASTRTLALARRLEQHVRRRLRNTHLNCPQQTVARRPVPATPPHVPTTGTTQEQAGTGDR
jgi:hypothetical protein